MQPSGLLEPVTIHNISLLNCVLYFDLMKPICFQFDQYKQLCDKDLRTTGECSGTVGYVTTCYSHRPCCRVHSNPATSITIQIPDNASCEAADDGSRVYNLGQMQETHRKFQASNVGLTSPGQCQHLESESMD